MREAGICRRCLTSRPGLRNVRPHGVGAVAQLGERLVRNEEVRGSIPLSSTTLLANLSRASLAARAAAWRKTRSNPQKAKVCACTTKGNVRISLTT